MLLIRPFRGLRVVPERAADVCAPPYDVVDTEEARELAAGSSHSFLHVSKPEIDFPPGTDPHDPEVYAAGRDALDRLREQEVLLRDPEPRLYLYRLVMGAHVQTGLVAAASVDAYRRDRIKRHEHTRADKVQDRARNADALDAHTGTLFLTYPAVHEIDRHVSHLTEGQPDVDFTAEDGVRHSLWVLEDPAGVEAMATAVNAMDALYIADGHHRSAAAAKLQEWRAEARESGDDVAPADWFLAVLFPDDQVRILPYNRVVSTLGDRTPEELVAALEEPFQLAPSPDPVEPERPRVFGMYLDGSWYRLELKPDRVPEDPVDRLDINSLQRECLEPLLGIANQRTDERIDFVGGIRGSAALESRVDSGEMKVAFSLHPTRLADVFAVSDRGEVMPPKSTWFEPKLRDGLVVLPLGEP